MDIVSFIHTITLTQIGLVFQLAILEGLLSFDNALALAALVSARLKNPLDRKRALLWGIWGAYVTRVGIVFIGVWLMAQDWIKLLAGLYLLWMAVNELLVKKLRGETDELDEAAENSKIIDASAADQIAPRASLGALWKTIIAVELMDVMFSIDSVAVALAVSDQKWVLIGGAIFGILMMRVAATYFIALIERFPILVETAFVLVGIAGLKVIAEVKTLHVASYDIPMPGLHIPEWLLLPVMLGILVGAIVLNAMFPERFKAKTEI